MALGTSRGQPGQSLRSTHHPRGLGSHCLWDPGAPMENPARVGVQPGLREFLELFLSRAVRAGRRYLRISAVPCSAWGQTPSLPSFLPSDSQVPCTSDGSGRSVSPNRAGRGGWQEEKGFTLEQSHVPGLMSPPPLHPALFWMDWTTSIFLTRQLQHPRNCSWRLSRDFFFSPKKAENTVEFRAQLCPRGDVVGVFPSATSAGDKQQK